METNMAEQRGVVTRGIAVLFAGLVVACGQPDGAPDAKKPGSEAKQATQRPTLSVSVVTPSAEEWPMTFTANGSIAAWQEASVGPEVAGLRISELLANVGDAVKRGQPLARLVSTTVEVEIAQLRASIADAEATLADARSNAERARQLDRTGAISAQQVDQLQTAERTATARLDVARARLRAEEIRLANTQVLAPDDGIVAARSGMLGAVVQPGQELFRLIRQGRLEWRAEVVAADLGRVKPGQKVQVRAASGASAEGRVRVVSPTVDPQTRMAIVYVDLPAGSAARAGMFASGEFNLGGGTVSTLPQSAVLRREGFDYVFVLEADDKVRLTKVDVGRRHADRIELRSPLPAGARLVASGLGFLNDGDRVRIVDAQPVAGGEGAAR